MYAIAKIGEDSEQAKVQEKKEKGLWRRDWIEAPRVYEAGEVGGITVGRERAEGSRRSCM